MLRRRLAEVRLTYFDLAGMGEPIRLSLAMSGMPFTDERLSFEQFGALKPTLKFGQLPCLTANGDQYFQARRGPHGSELKPATGARFVAPMQPPPQRAPPRPPLPLPAAASELAPQHTAERHPRSPSAPDPYPACTPPSPYLLHPAYTPPSPHLLPTLNPPPHLLPTCTPPAPRPQQTNAILPYVAAAFDASGSLYHHHNQHCHCHSH